MRTIKSPISFNNYKGIVKLPSGKTVKIRECPIIPDIVADNVSIGLAVIENIDGVPTTIDVLENMSHYERHYLITAAKQFYCQDSFTLPSGKHIKLRQDQNYETFLNLAKDLCKDELLAHMVAEINHQPVSISHLSSLTPNDYKIIIFRFTQLMQEEQ